MAVISPYNGQNYEIPEDSNESWAGEFKVDGLLIALAANVLQKTGGLWTLSGELDFGAAAGLKSLYFKTRTASPATAGPFRLAVSDQINWRNTANSANLSLAVDASDRLTFGGIVLAAAGAIGAANTVSVSTGTAPSWALLVNANISAVAAIAYSKLALAGEILNADIAAAAAIARSKLASGTNDHVLINSAAGVMSSEAALSPVRGGTGVANNAAATTTRSGNHALTLTTTAITSVTLPTTGTLATLLGAETLSGKTFSDALQVAEIATPTTPASGFTKIYPKTDNKLYYLNDLGTETEVGAGSGGINYCTNSGADGDVSGWTTYDDGAATPVDLTAGTFDGTFARTATLPLRGTGSFLYTPSALGEGVATTITPNLADYTKPIQISFDYTFVTANAAEGDYTVWVYDVTNSQLIQPTPYKIPSGIVAGQYRWMGQFQASATGVTYRVAIHQAAVTSALLKFDNVVIGPLVQVFGAPISEWTAYTPTCLLTGGTNTVTGFWRRLGDTIDVRIDALFNPVFTGGSASFGLPSGLSMDIAKLPGLDDSSTLLGSVRHVDTGSDYYAGDVVYSTTTTVIARLWVEDAGAASGHVATGNSMSTTVPMIWANNDRMHLTFSVPILGWGSSVVMSQDTDTRVVAAKYTTTVGTTFGNGTYSAAFPYATKVIDTHNAMSSGVYTCPVAGVYRVTSSFKSAAYAGVADRAIRLAVYKTGVIESVVASGMCQNTTSAKKVAAGSVLVECLAGGTLDLRGYCDDGAIALDGNADSNFVCIERISGPATIAASETITARYRTTAGQSMGHGATTLINFGTKDWDSHGSVTTGASWKFTAPSAGKFQVSVSSSLASGGGWGVGEALQLDIFKNGVADSVLFFKRTESANTNSISAFGSQQVSLLAGDYIDIRLYQDSGAAISLSVDGTSNMVSISRIAQ